MTTEYKENPVLSTVEIMVNGKVTETDYDQITTEMEAFIAQQPGKIKLIEIINDFRGFDWSILGKGIKFDMKHLKDFSHCAVVTDKGWIGPFSRLVGTVIECEIRVFKLDELDKARAWLESS